MADTKRLVVTREGLQKMKEELEYKETTEKMRIAEQLKVAISYGDLSENAEYDAAKNDQAALEQRINELRSMIENAVVVDESKINTDTVGIVAEITFAKLCCWKRLKCIHTDIVYIYIAFTASIPDFYKPYSCHR